MAEILRDVMIKPPVIQDTDVIISGIKGGELRFSLVQRASINPIHLNSKEQPLLVSCYRTKDFHHIDVSNYNGNKDEIIKLRANGEKSNFKYIMVYIISSDLKLIEYGKIRSNRSRSFSNAVFKYRTRTTHRFKEVKVVCGDFYQSASVPGDGEI